MICPTLPDPEALLPEIRAVFTGGRLSCGAAVAALEDDVKARIGVKHAIGVSSGTSGLMLLLRALNLPRGSEVITPSFTFAATSHALLWNGLKPVFCDCEPESFTMDASAAESLISERTSAIYPVCIFGVPGDVDAYQALADRYGLALVFDSAQGLCSTYKGRPLGGFGRGEVFSMSPTKVVTAMEGGLVTTDDDELAAEIVRMRDYGKANDGQDMQWLGLSARLPEVNAIIARWSLAHVDTWIANRNAIADRYMRRLGRVPGLRFQKIPDYCVPSRNYVIVLIDPERSGVTRDDVRDYLAMNGIQSKRYFYPALHNQTLYKDIEPGCGERLPVSERISRQGLALPMYSHMSLEMVDEVCDRVQECFEYATSI